MCLSEWERQNHREVTGTDCDTGAAVPLPGLRGRMGMHKGGLPTGDFQVEGRIQAFRTTGRTIRWALLSQSRTSSPPAGPGLGDAVMGSRGSCERLRSETPRGLNPNAGFADSFSFFHLRPLRDPPNPLQYGWPRGGFSGLLRFLTIWTPIAWYSATTPDGRKGGAHNPRHQGRAEPQGGPKTAADGHNGREDAR